MTHERWWYSAALCIALVACAREDLAEPRTPGAEPPAGQPSGDDAPVGQPSTNVPPTPGLTLSSLVPDAAPATSGARVFVGAMPSTRARAASAVITNARSHVTVVAPVTNGGFDPVPVPADAGDTIVVGLVDSAGASSALLGAVRRMAPPRVVRTSPVRGRSDTPLNLKVGVVFSAPVPPASAEANIRLTTAAGEAVPGRFDPVGTELVAYEFTPAAQALAPATAYRLEVAPDLRDVMGQRLGAAVTADFVTVASPPPSEPVTPPDEPVQSVWLRAPVYNRPVFVGERITVSGLAYGPEGKPVSADFTFEIPEGPLQLVWQGSASVVLHAAAPGRMHIVGRAAGLVDTLGLLVAVDVSPAEFAARRLLFSERGELVTMNGDGSDRAVLPTPTVAYHPSLGPDSRIIYSNGRPTNERAIDGEGALFIREPDGSILRFGEGDGETCPRWSPDGSRVASIRPRTAELVVRLRDGTVERIVSDADPTECAHWTPDGLRLFTGEDQVTLTTRYWWAGPIGPVAPDARRMLIPEAWRIADVDALADRNYPPMVEWYLGFQSTSGNSGSWSPDGEVLALAAWTSIDTESLWMMTADGVRRAAVPGVGRVDGVQVLR